MRHRCLPAILLLCVALLPPVVSAQENDVVAKAMRDELARTVAQLRLGTEAKPYFVAYRVMDYREMQVAASLGKITASHPSHRRVLGVELRIGDYALDSSNYLSPRNFAGGRSRMFSGIGNIPLDDNYLEIRRQLWLATDAEYKKAIEDFSGKRAALQTRKRTDETADFSREEPHTFRGPRVDIDLDAAKLEDLARQVSAAFRTAENVYVSGIAINFQNVYTRYLSSEGTSFTLSEPLLKLEIKGRTQAADGSPIEDSIYYWGRSVADLPPVNDLISAARQFAVRLEKLRSASTLENYNGPVLFEGQAAGEIFAQVFAPGLVASRPPLSDDPRFSTFFDQFSRQIGGGSFIEKIGGRVLPETMDVLDDARPSAGAKLLGSYPVDDDGLPARQTPIIQKGILKALLCGRTPVINITHSTANRRGWGPSPSNLIVTSAKTLSQAELRKELMLRVAQRGIEYGIVIRHVGGGGLEDLVRQAAFVTRQSAPSNTLVDVIKVFADGHEEQVRGLLFSDMTAANFKDIVAAGDSPFIYSSEFAPKMGTLFSFGMGSGARLPVVSFVVPSLLFEEVTLTRARGTFPRPPLSRPPLFDTADSRATTP